MIHNCPKDDGRSIERSKIVRFGSYFRSSDSRFIQRFRCPSCQRIFSTATDSPCFGQKKRRINDPLRQLLASGISLRRAARLLRVHRTTISRRLVFLGAQARLQLDRQLAQVHHLPGFQFDDLETFERAKCLPLSVTLAVSFRRKILGFEVSSMPAKGPLAALGRTKYGFRPDYRRQGLNTLFRRIRPHIATSAVIRSDQNPHYSAPVARFFPQASHDPVKGTRGCVTGQAELKRRRFDPLFALNHTCAMLRANVNRLFRRTWCSTKNAARLADHLAIYAAYHNAFLR